MPIIQKNQLTIDHIVLTVSDIQRTKLFYTKIFGDPEYCDDDSVMYLIGDTKLFLGLPYGELQPEDRFNPNRIGLEHLAFGVKSLEQLMEIEAHLTSRQIKHSGIHIDRHSNLEKIWLDDPDGIRIEFFGVPGFPLR